MVKKKFIGKVTLEEKREIQKLFERRNGLKELSIILNAEESELNEKFNQDVVDTDVKYRAWWNKMAKKYHWEYVSNGSWEVNFETCNVYLNIK